MTAIRIEKEQGRAKYRKVSSKVHGDTAQAAQLKVTGGHRARQVGSEGKMGLEQDSDNPPSRGER